MKSVFEVVLIIWLSLTFLFCMMIFSEEVLVKQEAIHIRNKVNEVIEINGGYTPSAESELNNLLSKISYVVTIDVSKKGKLNYGEKLDYKITIKYKRKLPFNDSEQDVQYSILGQFYNASY